MMRQTFEPQELERTQTISLMQAEEAVVDAQATPSVTAMIEGAHYEAGKWRRRRRSALILSGSLFSFSLVSLVLLALLPRGISFPIAYLGSIMLVLTGSLVGLLAAILMRPLRNNPINQLWDFKSTEAVGPLLECTKMLLPEMSHKANAALIRLLPRMQTDDLVRLTHYQRHCLRRLLDVGMVQEPSYLNMKLEGTSEEYVEATRQRFSQHVQERKEMVLAILCVFEQSSSELDLAVVAKLAAGKGRAGSDAEILAAAKRCLVSLQERCAQQRGNETFLRASEMPKDAGNTLLRPAQGTNTTDTAQLLRPEVLDKSVIP